MHDARVRGSAERGILTSRLFARAGSSPPAQRARTRPFHTTPDGEPMTVNSFGAKAALEVGDQTYQIFRLGCGRGGRGSSLQPEGTAGEPAADRGRRQHHRRPHPGTGRLGRGGGAERGDPVHAGPGDHAGLHRGAVCRRPGHHARGDGRSGRGRHQDQPAGPGRDGDRPLGDRRRVRHRRRVRAQRGDRVRPQPGALPVPALGPDRVRRLQGGPAGHRHRAPGQHRAPGPGGLLPRGRRRSCWPTRTPAWAPTPTPRW